MRRLGQAWLSALCVVSAAFGAGAAPAGAAEPEFVFFAGERPLPGKDFEGPCGLAVDSSANFYVADYYHHAVSVYNSARNYQTQLANVDPLDGPCGLAFGSGGRLYVNNYHRNVEKFNPSFFPPGTSTTYTSAGTIDSSHPTGVAVDPATGNVYVNSRTYIAAYDSTGAPLLDGGGDPLRIGVGTLGDGYGLAFSQYGPTGGLLYVPDAADDTVKAYNSNPTLDVVNPVETIDGSATPTGGFVSLHDSAVAIDRVTGDVYVADTLGPQFSYHPQAAIYVFSYDGVGYVYEGRLKYNIVDGSPPGLAVDNSTKLTQGRVYVTSGNTVQASIYAYPPGSAGVESAPARFSLAMSVSDNGGGSIASDVGGVDCSATCDAQIRSGAQVTLTAIPDDGFTFVRWSGGGCSGAGLCTVEMSTARSVSAEFAALSGPPAPAEVAGTTSASGAARSPVADISEIAQKGNLRVSVSGKLSPKRLPRTETAPIAVSVGGTISTTDGTLPPQLKTMRIELNRNGKLDYAGLPTCVYSKIQPGSSSRALSGCRSSLVGRGSFTANITLAGQEPYPTRGRLLVFNSVRGGKPVLYGHIYSASPFATSFVIVFRIERLKRGTYGIALNAPLPKAMDAWGSLTGLEMTLSRRYNYKGRSHSYISSGCPAPRGFPSVLFPLARASFSFVGGTELSSVFTSTCKARR